MCTVYLWVVDWRYCIYWLYFVVGILYTVYLNVCLFFVFISTASVRSIVGVMVGTLRVAWSEEEDAVLRVLVGLHGCRWDAVAGGLSICRECSLPLEECAVGACGCYCCCCWL